MRKQILLTVAALGLIAGCTPDEPKPTTIKEYSVTLTAFSGFSDKDGASLPFQWNEGDSVSLYTQSTPCIFQAADSGTTVEFRGQGLGEPGGYAMFPYSPSAAYASSTVYGVIPSTQEAVSGGYDHNAVLAAGPIAKGKASMECLCALLRFHVGGDGVELISIQAGGGEKITGNCRVSVGADSAFGKVNASSPSVIVKPDGSTTFAQGTYCAVVAPATFQSGVVISAYRSDGSVEQRSILNSFTTEAGRISDLGTIYGEEEYSGEPSDLAIEMHFKNDGALYDYTASGSSWPFKESKGASTNHIFSNSLTTSSGGFPISYSGTYYYLNSKAGLRLAFNDSNGYLQFPAIDGARLKKVTFGAGNNKMSPRITDDCGNTVPGGGTQKCSDASLHTWELTDSKEGEGYRIMFANDVVNILQLNLYYECQYPASASKVGSITAADERNASFGSNEITLTGRISPAAGASMSELKYGFEYRKKLSTEGYTQIPCTSSSTEFSAKVSLDEGEQYEYRSWACNRGSWKVYSAVQPVRSQSLLVDFWRFGEPSQPFEANIPVGSTAAQALSGTENSWTLKGSDFTIGSFTPKGCSLDLSSSKGLRISSSGTSGQLTWLKIPGISGKTIKEVVLNTFTLDSSDLCVNLSKTVSSASAAENSSVSAMVLLYSDESNEIYTMRAESGQPYYLVFNSAGDNYIKSMEIVYKEGGSDKFEEEPDDMSADPAGSFDYAKMAAKGHPRLLLDSEDFADLNHKVILQRSSYAILSSFHDKIVSLADSHISEPLPTYTLDESGTRLLTQSRNALRCLFHCAYAYRMTANEKYLWKCRETLKAVCAFPDWHPVHFLDVGEMAIGVAIAYDWLYYDLTLEERAMAHTALRDFAIGASNGHWFYDTCNNWNQVCSAGMLASAIAIYEKDKSVAASQIEKVYSSNKKVNSVLYAPDGNYGEGYDYWDYGTLYETILIQLLETAFDSDGGIPDCPGFMNTSEFMLFMTGPGGPFSYSDGGSSAEDALLGQWWFASHSGNNALLYNELRNREDGLYDSSESRVFPAVMAFAKDIDFNKLSASKPTKKIWYGNGDVPVVMVHTDWTYSDTDHYLGIKAGAAGSSHGHMDAGSFVYDALGVRWSYDRIRTTYTTSENALAAAGFGGQLFDMSINSHRWDIFNLNNLSHSTLSVAASDGTVERFHVTDHFVYGGASIDKVIETSTELGARLNMTDVYKGQLASAYRTVKLVNETDLVVIDELTALPGMDAPVTWRMVTKADIAVSTSGVSLTMDDKKMYLTATASPSASIKYADWNCTRPTDWEPRDWDPKDPSYRMAGFDATVPAGKTVTFTTKLSPNK